MRHVMIFSLIITQVVLATTDPEAGKRHEWSLSKKRIVGGICTGLLTTAAVTGSITSMVNTAALNNQVSPVTFYPYAQPSMPPNITHKPECTYSEYASGYFPSLTKGTKGDCSCWRGLGCRCIEKRCPGAESYQKHYQATCGGQITTLVASILLGVSVLGYAYL